MWYIVSLLLFQFYYSSEAVWSQYWLYSNCTSNIFIQSVPDNICISGVIISCSGNTVLTHTYGNSNCSGAPLSTTNTTNGKCNPSIVFSNTQNCGPLPFSSYLATSSYTNSNCQGSQPQFITQLDICQTSGNFSSLASCTSNGLTVLKLWNASSCSGPPLGATYQPTYSCFKAGPSSSGSAICSGSLASPIPYGTISFDLYSSCQTKTFISSGIYPTNLCETSGLSSSFYLTCDGNSATYKSYLTADCSGSVNITATTSLNTCNSGFIGANLTVTACTSSGTWLHAHLILFCLFYFFLA